MRRMVEASIRRRALLLALPALPADLMFLMHLLIGWDGVPLPVYDVMFQLAFIGGVVTIVTLPLLIRLTIKNASHVAPATAGILGVAILAAAAPLVVAAIFIAAINELRNARFD